MSAAYFTDKVQHWECRFCEIFMWWVSVSHKTFLIGFFFCMGDTKYRVKGEHCHFGILHLNTIDFARHLNLMEFYCWNYLLICFLVYQLAKLSELNWWHKLVKTWERPWHRGQITYGVGEFVFVLIIVKYTKLNWNAFRTSQLHWEVDGHFIKIKPTGDWTYGLWNMSLFSFFVFFVM